MRCMKGSEANESIPKPLKGVRVVDLTQVLAGPFCTMILADLGADVVKIERPGRGDDARHFGPFLPSGVSIYFAGVNRGKRSVVLDLQTSDGREVLRRLVSCADVFVENLRPGALDDMGLGVEALRQANPRLIYASISGFGRTGQRAARPAYDVIAQAMSGLMSVTGEGPGQALRVGTSISDILGGLFSVIGILAALHERHAVGEGRHVDVALLDSTVAAMENAIGRYTATGDVPEPMGTRHPAITPFQAFAAQDRTFVVAAGNDRLFAALCRVLGCEDIGEDPRFETNASRTEHQAELETRLNAIFVADKADAWLARLEGAGVPCAPVASVAEVAVDAGLRERGMLHAMSDAEGGTFTTAGSPLNFDSSHVEVSSGCPGLGADTEAVLADWLGGETALN